LSPAKEQKRTDAQENGSCSDQNEWCDFPPRLVFSRQGEFDRRMVIEKQGAGAQKRRSKEKDAES